MSFWNTIISALLGILAIMSFVVFVTYDVPLGLDLVLLAATIMCSWASIGLVFKED